MNFARRNTFLIALIGLLVVGAVVFLAFSGNRVRYGEADSSLEVIKRMQQMAAGEASRTDTDDDGLYDWEETLWGTDPKNSDSDGDGTPDGKEADERRNPTLASPDDELAVDEATGEISFPTREGENELTQIDRASQQFFGRYLQLREAGELENPNSQQELFKIILDSIPQASAFNSLTEKDILISIETSPESARNYGNLVGETLSRYDSGVQNEAVILLRALEKEDPSLLADLEKNVETYRGLYTELKMLVAPADAAALHLELLNAVGSAERSAQDMQRAFDDPAVMFGAVMRHENERERLLNAFVRIQSYLHSKDIVFMPHEPGWVFTPSTQAP